MPFIIRSDHDLSVGFNTTTADTDAHEATFGGMVYVGEKVTQDHKGRPITGVNVNVGKERGLQVTQKYTGIATNNSPYNIATNLQVTLSRPLDEVVLADRRFGLVGVEASKLETNATIFPHYFVENPRTFINRDLKHTVVVKGTVYQFRGMAESDYNARTNIVEAPKDSVQASGYSVEE